MASFTKFNQTVADLANKVSNLGSDTLKMALFTTATAPTAADATYNSSTNVLNSSGSAEVANGNGYTSGGVTVTISSSTQTSGTYKLIPGSNPSWTASGAVSNIRYAVLYNSTAGTSTARPLIGFWDYGSPGVTLANTDTFTVTLDNALGILQLS